MSRLTGRQIQLILAAVATLESWDSKHPAIASDRDGGWAFSDGLPLPSRALIVAIRAQERREQVAHPQPSAVTFSRSELDAIITMACIADAGAPEGDYQDWTSRTYRAADSAAGKAAELIRRMDAARDRVLGTKPEASK